MLQVTGEAAQSFMHAAGSAVVTGENLARGKRRVALIAQGLPLVRAEFYELLAIEH